MSADADTLRVTLNGEAAELPAGTTVAALAEHMTLTAGRYAVEIDGSVVPRSQHAERALQPGERVEIVTFVGGG